MKDRAIKNRKRYMKIAGLIAFCSLAIMTCGMSAFAAYSHHQLNEYKASLASFWKGFGNSATVAYHDNDTYVFVNKRAPFEQAKESCEAIGMTLSSIESEQENIFIKGQIIGTSYAFWIGGVRDTVNPQKWRWLSGNDAWLPRSTHIYQNWYPNQPYYKAVGTEDCIAVEKSGKWHDYPCFNNLCFLCKADKE